MAGIEERHPIPLSNAISPKLSHRILVGNQMTKVLISILNWKAADQTLECVQSVQRSILPGSLQCDIRVVDNGSGASQVDALKAGLPSDVDLVVNPVNTGFTGGQNLNINHALAHGYDYVFLLNNDAVVDEKAIAEVIREMSADPRCGAASPLIVRMGNRDIVDFCGAVHDWQNISAIRPTSLAEAQTFLVNQPEQIWAVGTALMLKVAALREVGVLDERMFAYYEDDDMGARLSAAGWRTRIVLNAVVEHACFDGDMYQRQPYFFYLMTRNAIFFALKHVPRGFRKALRLKFIDRSLVMAEKLFAQGQDSKAQACLLGLADGLAGRGGPPVLGRPVPLWVRALRPVSRAWNARR